MTKKRRLYMVEWRNENKDRCRKMKRRWKLEHPEIVRISNRKSLLKNMEHRREYMKAYKIVNAKHIADEQRDRLAKYKRLVVDAYGGCCECCGEVELVFLTLEHTLRNGRDHRVQEGKGNFYLSLINRRFPKNEGLAILCMNCNWATRHGAKCPHHEPLLQIVQA